MQTKETNELLESLPDDVQQVVLAVSILISRIGSLPASDRDDLFELLTAWRSAGDPDEQRAVRRAMIEILTQGKTAVTPMSLSKPNEMPGRLKNWARHVGARIRQLRENAKMTQGQLAEKAGLPQSHISRLENAEHCPTHMTLQKIAEAVGVHVRDLDVCAE